MSNNYNVDDILYEIRQRKNAESKKAASKIGVPQKNDFTDSVQEKQSPDTKTAVFETEDIKVQDVVTNKISDKNTDLFDFTFDIPEIDSSFEDNLRKNFGLMYSDDQLTDTEEKPSGPKINEVQENKSKKIKPKKTKSKNKIEKRKEGKLIDEHKENAIFPETEEDVRSMTAPLILRLIFSILIFVCICYLYVASVGLIAFPPLSFISPVTVIASATGLLAIDGLINAGSIGTGFAQMLKGKGNTDSYLSLAFFAALIQGTFGALNPSSISSYSDLFLPFAAILIIFNVIGKLIHNSMALAGIRFTESDKKKYTAIVIDDDNFISRLELSMYGDEPSILASAVCEKVKDFVISCYERSKTEETAKVLAPVVGIGSLLISAVSYMFSNNIFSVLSVFAGALCITAPLTAVILSYLPVSSVNKKLKKYGAIICGPKDAEELSQADGIAMSCSDLFPASSVTIHGIKTFTAETLDQSIIDAASVLCECDSTLSNSFREMISDKKMLSPVESQTYEDSLGISAWVDRRRILIGNRDMMDKYGVVLPPEDFEERYKVDDRHLLYLAVAGKLAAMFIVSYSADKSTKRILKMMANREITLCLTTCDPNVTPGLLEDLFGFPQDLVRIIPADILGEFKRITEPKKFSESGLIHNGSIISFVRAVIAARLCGSNMSLIDAMTIVSIIFGFAIVTFLAFTNTISMLTWLSLAVFQVFWSVVEILIPSIRS